MVIGTLLRTSCVLQAVATSLLRLVTSASVFAYSEHRSNREKSSISDRLQPRDPWWELVLQPELPSLCEAPQQLVRVPQHLLRFSHRQDKGVIVKNPVNPFKRSDPYMVKKGGPYFAVISYGGRLLWPQSRTPESYESKRNLSFRVFRTSEKS